MKKCLSCGQEIPQDSIFCPFCGSDNTVEPEMCYCRKCGKKLENDSIFCSYCGEKVASRPTNSIKHLVSRIQNYSLDNLFAKSNPSFTNNDFFRNKPALLITVLLIVCILFAGLSVHLYSNQKAIINGLASNSDSGFHVSKNIITDTEELIYVYSKYNVRAVGSRGISYEWKGNWNNVKNRNIPLIIKCKSGTTGTILLTEKETGKVLCIVVKG